MVHFIRYDSFILFHSDARCRNLSLRVTPFGYPGINGYVLLHRALRSLSRPSSSVSSKASAMDLYSLDHIIFPSPAAFFRYARTLSVKLYTFTRLQQASILVSSFPVLFKELYFMEIRGLEPLTLGLQSRCSSQLS